MLISSLELVVRGHWRGRPGQQRLRQGGPERQSEGFGGDRHGRKKSWGDRNEPRKWEDPAVCRYQAGPARRCRH